MKRIKKIYSLSLLLCLFLSGINLYSQDENQIDLTPKPHFPEFKVLEVSGLLDVVIIKGDEQKIYVKSSNGKEVGVLIEADEGVLSLTSRRPYRKGAVIYVVYEELNAIEIHGAANLSSDNIIETDKFVLESHGAANCELKLDVQKLYTEMSGASYALFQGNADEHYAELSGASNLFAKKLKTQKTIIETHGVANAEVFVSNKITSVTEGASNVEIFGKPEIRNITKSGSSSIVFVSDEIGKSDDSNSEKAEDKDVRSIKIAGINVDVYEADDSVKVVLGGTEFIIDNEGKLEIKRKNRNKFKGHWDGLDIGINGYLNSDNKMKLPTEYEFLELDIDKSVGVSVNFLSQSVNLWGQQLGLVTGLGIQINNYRFDNDIVLVEDSATIYGYKSTTVEYEKSKLVASYLTLPLMLEFQTKKNNKHAFHVAAGVLVGIKYRTHSKRVYIEDGKKKKPKDFDDFNMNPFKYDVIARIGWGPINLFANYSLATMFQDEKGPEVYPFFVGITLIPDDM